MSLMNSLKTKLLYLIRHWLRLWCTDSHSHNTIPKYTKLPAAVDSLTCMAPAPNTFFCYFLWYVGNSTKEVKKEVWNSLYIREMFKIIFRDVTKILRPTDYFGQWTISVGYILNTIPIKNTPIFFYIWCCIIFDGYNARIFVNDINQVLIGD